MNDPVDPYVSERLQRLERVRRIHSLLLGAFAVAAFVVWVAPGRVEAIRAERFDLVDSTGSVRASLMVRDSGEAGLYIHDDSSRVRIGLSHGAAGTGLSIRDREGDTRIGVIQFAHGGGGVALHGEGLEGAAVLYLKDGEGSLSVYDVEGNVIDRIPATRD